MFYSDGKIDITSKVVISIMWNLSCFSASTGWMTILNKRKFYMSSFHKVKPVWDGLSKKGETESKTQKQGVRFHIYQTLLWKQRHTIGGSCWISSKNRDFWRLKVVRKPSLPDQPWEDDFNSRSQSFLKLYST